MSELSHEGVSILGRLESKGRVRDFWTTTKLVMVDLQALIKEAYETMQKEALQFRIGLIGIVPLAWRRILVPADYTLWDFHDD